MKRILSNIKTFIKCHVPVMCARCMSIHFEKTMKYEWSTTGKQVALCPKCHHELFTPFSGVNK